MRNHPQLHQSAYFLPRNNRYLTHSSPASRQTGWSVPEHAAAATATASIKRSTRGASESFAEPASPYRNLIPWHLVTKRALTFRPPTTTRSRVPDSNR